MATAKYLVGDVFDRMAELPDGSVDLVLTSPPFLALRSYLPDGHPDKAKEIGSEATPAEFLDTLLALTAEWGRILAPHGSIAVELGDTYAGSGGAGGDYDSTGIRDGQPRFTGSAARTAPNGQRHPSGHGAGWPLDKSLCGIPTLYAWSLAYGRNLLTGAPSPAGQWRVRNLVAWVRPNPPVGALGDKFRPATSYLIIACRARDRYFDLDAVRTATTLPASPAGNMGYDEHRNERGRQGPSNKPVSGGVANPAGAPPLDWHNHVDALIDDEIRARNGRPNGSGGQGGSGTTADAVGRIGRRFDQGTNNVSVGAQGSHIRRRLEAAGYFGGPTDDVWDITPGGFSGAHYAVYPPELCVRPILAMTPQRVCTTCGEPSRRIVESARHGSRPSGEALLADPDARREYAEKYGYWAAGKDGGRQCNPNLVTTYTTVGWSDCDCPGDDRWRPGHVLDPFAGSGTTLAVATGHGREATGIDIDPRNARLAQERCGMFLEIHDKPTEAVS